MKRRLMKRLLFALSLMSLFVLFFIPSPRADESPKLMTNFGELNIYWPLTQVDTVYQWDFVEKRSLVGGETPLGSYHRLTFTGGAVTSLEGQGTPFIGARLDLVNPAEGYVPLAAIHPGLFAGRDFRKNAWIYGVKFSVNVF